MSRLTNLGPRIPPAAARLSRRPKITEQFYSSAEWRDLIRTLIATRGRRCEDKQCKAPDVGAAKRTRIGVL
jgi:hypothetical protein